MHPDLVDKVTMDQLDGGFSYQFDSEFFGGTAWTTILTGQFSGGEAATGSGSMALDFAASSSLGISQPNEPVTGSLTVNYDLGSDPQTIELNTTAASSQLQAFDYNYQRFADGHGSFVFELVNPAGDVLKTTVQFLADGSGKATVVATLVSGASGSLVECWDPSACVDYLDDPFNVTRQCGVLGRMCRLATPACVPAGPDGS